MSEKWVEHVGGVFQAEWVEPKSLTVRKKVMDFWNCVVIIWECLLYAVMWVPGRVAGTVLVQRTAEEHHTR